MCAILKSRAMNIGSNERLYVTAQQPGNAMDTGQTFSEDGNVYKVFTTSTLQSSGLGYIFRWRTMVQSGNYGPWRSVSSQGWNVDPDIASHPYFYQGSFLGTNCNTVRYVNLPNGFASFADWTTHLSGSTSMCFYFYYGVEFMIRYVMIQDASNAELDISTKNVTTNIAVFRPRPQASNPVRGTISQTITINYPPWGTCTTGNVVVPLYANQGELLIDGDSSTPVPFDITLTKCPRVNISYSFAAPNGIGYDNVNGVVDMDSASNAKGVGIQLRHRNDPAYANNTIVFNPTDYANTPTYVRNAPPQCESQGTCTDTPTGVNHTIPMQAAVFRKSAITPGKINASVLFHIVYP